MILTETYFRKISVLMLPKESQALEETLAEAQSVLKEAHSKGVELECILEVREGKTFLMTVLLFRTLMYPQETVNYPTMLLFQVMVVIFCP